MKKVIESTAAVFELGFKLLVGGVALIFLALFSYLFFYSSQNKKVIESKLVGTEVIVPPNAGKAKMFDWGGWTDKYLHLLLKDELKEARLEQFMISFTQFEKITKLKVFEVRRQNEGVGSYNEICFLREEEKPEDVIVTPCMGIPAIETYTNLVIEALDLIKNNGEVILTRDMNLNELNPKTIVIKNEADLWRELAVNCPGFTYVTFRIVKNKVEANP